MTAVDDFDFALPSELIAQDAAPRGESRLLVLDRAAGSRTHASVRDLPRFLRAGDLLVANDTKVFPARLIGRRVPSGGVVECVLLAREERTGGSEVWSALMHPGQKLKPGATVRFESGASALMAEVLERQFFGRRTIRLWSQHGDDIDTLVDRIGRVPLPPYIHRSDTDADRERYQTVFASRRGSVAAPTAGLHFDRALLDAVERAGVERATITLHVGYGTFKPVRAAQVEDHVVDPEPYEMSAAAVAAINRALADRRRVIAIGTTTTRALEDAAQRGDGRVTAGRADAGLFIHSAFRFQVISGLVTNFHLPRSSLLMLVAAFGGREHVLAAYRDAIARRYRFYSYGDAMLVI
ncbi:MAG: tRNA preQ1(34) S-adenosylmethionine ribosyltransferase-isomerase QueA [Vicinamibacterales bacterium]